MQIVKYVAWEGTSPTYRVAVLRDGKVRPLRDPRAELAGILHVPNPADAAQAAWDEAEEEHAVASVQLAAPIDRQEVWGAGVTYERSKVAREAESERAATFYDLVYHADRPELFFKATPSRVSGPGVPIRARADARWTVPEPELGLVLSPQLKIVGYTIGNDVSARDIEGANPLYLPQAKTYDASCGLGPAITLVDAMPPLAEVQVGLEVDRGGVAIIRDSTSLSRMKRRLEELVDWLGRDNRFVEGAILLTGTGIVPPDDFTLEAGDEVRITIDGIGTLTNPVVRGVAG